MAGVVSVVSGIAGLRSVFRKSKAERELEEQRLAVVKCQQQHEVQELRLRRCQQAWQWAAFTVIIAGAVLLLSRYSMARSL